MQLTPEKISQARVLVVGDAMLDRYWYGAVDRISPEAPVPVVRVTRTEERIGAAANVAYNIVTLGAQSSLLSVVGDDEASHQLEALVAKTGITPYFGRDPQLKTTVKLRVIGRQQQLIRLDFENTPENEVLASQSATFEKLFPQHDAVLFSDYGKGGLAHIVTMIERERYVVLRDDGLTHIGDRDPQVTTGEVQSRHQSEIACEGDLGGPAPRS